MKTNKSIPAIKVSAAQMREIDRKTTSEFGIPSIVLMENAGRAVAEQTKRLKAKKIAVFCGPGNNGGDGLVSARYLSEWGIKVRIILIKPAKAYRGDALTNFNITRKLKIPVTTYEKHSPLHNFDMIIDAMLGTGTKGDISGVYRDAIDEINNSGKKVLSIDIPSGINADTGKVLGIAVKADITVTMALPKIGLLKPFAAPFTGRLFVADIGIPEKLLSKYQ